MRNIARMPRNWVMNALTGLAALMIVGVAIAMSPAVRNDPPSEATLPVATPPPTWTDPKTVAMGRIVVEGASASSFRVTSATAVFGAGEYDIDEANFTIALSRGSGVPSEYLAVVEVVRGDERELHAFSGLEPFWIWSGGAEGVDTSGRPAPFQLSLTPSMVKYQVWAKDCASRVTTDPPEMVNRGRISYGAAPGASQSVEFIGENPACQGLTVHLTSLGGYARS